MVERTRKVSLICPDFIFDDPIFNFGFGIFYEFIYYFVMFFLGSITIGFVVVAYFIFTHTIIIRNVKEHKEIIIGNKTKRRSRRGNSKTASPRILY